MVFVSSGGTDNKALRELVEYAKKTDKQTRVMIRLTKSIMALTIAIGILTVIQIIALFYP